MNTPHLDDLDLLDLSLGSGSHDHLADCPACDAALIAAREALHLLAQDLPPLTPPPELRARILASVAGPLTDHAPRLATLFVRDEPEMHAMLERIATGTARWRPFLPGIELHPVRPGLEGHECGILRVAPGQPFPHHRHIGGETIRVLAGSCTDSSGVILGPGDELDHLPNTSHSLQIHAGRPLLLAFFSAGTELTG